MGLLSLLPGRHADFALQMSILDLQNVPLVSGSFSVEWRFKSSKAHPEAVLNDKAQALSSRSHHNLTHLTSSSTTSPSSNSLPSDPRSRTVSGSHPPPPPHQPLRKTPTSTSFSTLTTTTTNSSTTSSTSSSTTTSSSPHSSSLGIGRQAKSKSSSSKTTRRRARAASYKDEHGVNVSTSSRGQTEGVQIREHACSWRQEVRSHIRLGVGAGKDSLGVLGERMVSLVVHQHLTAHDATDKSARLGQLDLNLAEFAGKGRVTRRYLLDEGKTNATIKLSIALNQIGGQTEWISLPITKGQAAGAGLEDLVGNHNRPLGDVRASPSLKPSMSSASIASKQHPRSSNLSRAPSSLTLPSHTPPNPSSRVPSSSNLTSLLHPANPALKASTVSFSSLPTTTATSSNPPTRKEKKPDQHHHKPTAQQQRPDFPSRPSQTAGGAAFLAPTSTEAIIENLFNPFVSNTPGPFTVQHAPALGTRTNSAEEQEGEFVMIGKGMKEGSPLNPHPVKGKEGGKGVVPSAWKKKGRVESSGRGREEGHGVAGGEGMSRAASRERVKV